MSVLLYIIRKRLKNTFLEILHKPGKCITWLVIIASVVFTLVLSLFADFDASEELPRVYLKAAVFAYMSLIVVLNIKQGLSNGGTMFEMNDVNFLFTSPVDPRKILLYGVIQMAKTALITGFILIVQGNTFRLFGVDLSGLFIVLLGFVLGVCVMQVGTMVIYCLTNGRAKRKRLVKILTVAVYLPFALDLGISYISSGDFAEALEHTFHSPAVAWIPVVGWTTAGPFAIYEGRSGVGFFLLGLCVLTMVLLILFLLKSRVDYYEDVLVATETAFERKRDMAEGNINMQMVTKQKKVKLTGTGIGGWGASAFLYKHMREDFRESRFGPWGWKSLFAIGISIVYAYVMREAGIMIAIFFILLMQTFFIGTGRGLLELYSPSLYMVPERPLKKIIWMNMELMIRALGESILIAVAFGIIFRASPIMLLVSVLTYLLYNFQLIGANYLSLRVTGVELSGVFTMILYMLLQLVITAPGFITPIVISVLLPQTPDFILLGIFAVWELIAGLGCFAIASRILHNCDMPILKPKQ